MNLTPWLDRLKEWLQNAPAETLRFMRSWAGVVVLILAGIAGGALGVWLGYGGMAVMSAYCGVMALLVILSLPCFDVVEVQYKKWMYAQWHSHWEKLPEAEKRKATFYRSWREVPGPSAGYREKLNTRWYE